MDFAWPQPLDRRQMLRRAVTFVIRKPVTRISAVQLDHQPIARHLRQHTRRRDRVALAIPFHEWRVWKLERLHRSAINEHVLRRRPDLIQRQVHRPMRRLKNVQLIDQLHIHARDRASNLRMRRENRVIMLALFLRELFRVIEPAKLPIKSRLQPRTWERHRRRDNRPGQGSATRLVNSRHVERAFLPQLSFESKPVPKLRAHRRQVLAISPNSLKAKSNSEVRILSSKILHSALSTLP